MRGRSAAGARSYTRLAALLALALITAGCVQGSIWVTPSQDPPEPPVPEKLEGEAPPRLEPSGVEGILVARDVGVPLYFEPTSELWYRYWRRRWYQAFHWDGNWFRPEQVPVALVDGPPGRETEEKAP